MAREKELFEAARKGNSSFFRKMLYPKSKSVPFVQLLLKGPQINCQDQTGSTPLHLAALNNHKEVVEILLKLQASANTPDHKGCYPLHLAAWTGNQEICKVLLTQGPSFASVNAQNLEGDTALHTAAQHGHTNVASLLLQKCANPLMKNSKDEKALDLAVKFGRLDTVQLFLDFPDSKNYLSISRFDCSPLHLAAKNGNAAVVGLLLDAGFDVKHRTETGTALHEAALFGRCEVLQLLLSRGGDVSIRDNNDKTVLDLLEQLNNPVSIEMKRMIEEYERGRLKSVQQNIETALCLSLGDDYDIPPVRSSNNNKNNNNNSINNNSERSNSKGSNSSNNNCVRTDSKGSNHSSRCARSNSKGSSKSSGSLDKPLQQQDAYCNSNVLAVAQAERSESFSRRDSIQARLLTHTTVLYPGSHPAPPVDHKIIPPLEISKKPPRKKIMKCASNNLDTLPVATKQSGESGGEGGGEGGSGKIGEGGSEGGGKGGVGVTRLLENHKQSYLVDNIDVNNNTCINNNNIDKNMINTSIKCDSQTENNSHSNYNTTTTTTAIPSTTTTTTSATSATSATTSATTRIFSGNTTTTTTIATASSTTSIISSTIPETTATPKRDDDASHTIGSFLTARESVSSVGVDLGVIGIGDDSSIKSVHPEGRIEDATDCSIHRCIDKDFELIDLEEPRNVLKTHTKSQSPPRHPLPNTPPPSSSPPSNSISPSRHPGCTSHHSAKRRMHGSKGESAAATPPHPPPSPQTALLDIQEHINCQRRKSKDMQVSQQAASKQDNHRTPLSPHPTTTTTTAVVLPQKDILAPRPPSSSHKASDHCIIRPATAWCRSRPTTISTTSSLLTTTFDSLGDHEVSLYAHSTTTTPGLPQRLSFQGKSTEI